ncbi:hypothetical protein [Ruminococcus sp.]|uniref:hypothetical protein n=1 Tax=Ruminococcus sp. TaxID=41978 RepID=UPI0025E98F4C|nr:hypothetical protein [Ruminococcus sp.]MBR1430462.1 hypothetical protein [Ruminococcus sp.]
MKNTVRSLIDICIIMCGVFLIIHRRVISAALTGEQMPEAPEWHKKFCPCKKEK